MTTAADFDARTIDQARQLAACTDTESIMQFYASVLHQPLDAAADAYPAAFSRAAGYISDLLFIISHHNSQIAEAHARGYSQGYSKGAQAAADGDLRVRVLRHDDALADAGGRLDLPRLRVGLGRRAGQPGRRGPRQAGPG